MRRRSAGSRAAGLASAVAPALVAGAFIVSFVAGGCGGKERKPADTGPRIGAQESSGVHAPESPGAGSPEGAVRSSSGAKLYSYADAALYVRDLQERLQKNSSRLDDIERLVKATDAPETAEMEARTEVLRSLSEDIDDRAIQAENSATEKDWPVWQQSLERDYGNLVRSTAYLDSMVTAVRRGP